MGYHLVLTFVSAVIRNEREEVLIGRHPANPTKPYPGLHDFPGGKLEPNESPAECVAREVKEETGLEVVFATLVGVFHHSGRNVRSLLPNCLPGLCLCYQVVAGGELRPAEMEEMHWAGPEELRRLANEGQLTPWCEYFLRDFI